MATSTLFALIFFAHYLVYGKTASLGSIEGRITAGNTAKAAQFPYHVGVLPYNQISWWWCSGSIIGTEWILTTGECVHLATHVTIYYGGTKRELPVFTQTVSVAYNVIRHPDNDPWIALNDIALIKTPAVVFDDFVQKIELPRLFSLSYNYDGKWATFTGWGKTKDKATVYAENLQYATFELVSHKECQNEYADMPIDENIVCAATPTKTSPCLGDNGGPLVLENTKIQVGIATFWSDEACTSSKYAGFTRVDKYLRWIKLHTGITYY